MRRIATLSMIFFLGLALPVLTGCPQQTQIKVGGGGTQVPAQGGPPAHAPAWGARAKHKYVYYPSANIYYESARGVYFFLSGGVWQVSA